MIPVGDSVHARGRPIANWLLILVCFLVFCVQLAQGRHAEAFLYEWGLVPARLTGLAAPFVASVPPVVTLLTSMFLHGGWGHLLGNLLFLWVFGDNVEDAMGSRRYIAFYLLCGLVAAGIQVSTEPWAAIPMVGASGAISGVLGAYLVMYPRAMVTVVFPIFLVFPIVDVPAVLLLVVWFLTQFTNGLLSLFSTVGAGGIAWWAHIGGFVAGVLLIRFFRRSRSAWWYMPY